MLNPEKKDALLVEGDGSQGAMIETLLLDRACDVSYCENAFQTLELSGFLDRAIDDFGVGYSSLSYVERSPSDVIRIDRSLMDFSVPANTVMIKAITAIADGLELEGIAEGIESDHQVAFIRDQGCTIIQGYFYSPPLRYAELKAYLTQTFTR